jgi:hypothetical protein
VVLGDVFKPIFISHYYDILRPGDASTIIILFIPDDHIIGTGTETPFLDRVNHDYQSVRTLASGIRANSKRSALDFTASDQLSA